MRWLVLCLALAAPAGADTLIAAHTIRAKSLLGPSDLTLAKGDTPGALSDPEAAIGMEARVTLYAGRPIRAGDLGPPALVERNQIVPLIYDRSGLRIATEARVLARGGLGDLVRAMNLDSRTTVTGTVARDGTILVTGMMP